ncbi:MAG TPA: transposase [Holophaga sp.]|nr:transposase [Holophaga sp.]
MAEGDAHTVRGQAERLTWMLEIGLPVASYRGDAGMPSARLMKLLNQGGVDFTMRLHANSKLDELAQDLCPAIPKMGGAVAFSECPYRAGTWDRERRVVVKFQVPQDESGAPALFTENFYFVTTREDAPAEVVEHYLARGEAERRIGEFKAAFEPTFRHAEMDKNQVWASLLALAHNVLVDLRERVKGEPELKPRPSLKPLREGSGWSVLATTYQASPVLPSLARFRAFALKLANAVVRHARIQFLRLHPQHLKPAWPSILAPA